eukprot:218548_1
MFPLCPTSISRFSNAIFPLCPPFILCLFISPFQKHLSIMSTIYIMFIHITTCTLFSIPSLLSLPDGSTGAAGATGAVGAASTPSAPLPSSKSFECKNRKFL